MTPMAVPRFFRLALVLGLLTAIGPFAIDMYLPALPMIGSGLDADIGSVQLTLTAFLVALGAGQLVFGPLSDMFGRKPPLYFGLALFAVASVGCALVDDIHTLIALRFVQGLGAAGGMAIPRAIVRDLHTGNDAARLMSLLMLVFSISPILAPLTGSGIIAIAGWRGVFWAVTLAAVAGLLLASRVLKETRPPEQRRDSSLGRALAAYVQLLRDRHFLGLVFTGAFGMAGFFVYLANSAFVFINHWHLTPTQYSLAFALNAVAFFGASQFTAYLGRRIGLPQVVRLGVLGAGVTMLLMVVYFGLGGDRMAALIGLYFVASAFLGLVVPSTAVLALDGHGAIAGTASAMMGMLQMLTGSLAMALMTLFTDGTPLPMVAGMAIGMLLALALGLGTLGRPRALIVPH